MARHLEERLMLRRLTGIFSVLSWSRGNFVCFLICATVGGVNAAAGNWGVAAFCLAVAALNLLLGAANGIARAMRTRSGR